MEEIKNKVNIKKNNLWFPCHQSTLLKEDNPQISHLLRSQGCGKAAGLWKNKTFMLARTRVSPGTCKQVASDQMRGPSGMKQAVNYTKLESSVSTQSQSTRSLYMSFVTESWSFKQFVDFTTLSYAKSMILRSCCPYSNQIDIIYNLGISKIFTL